MSTKLVLKDGTELQESYLVEANGKLWVYCYAEISFGGLVALLDDPEKTAKIILVQDGEEIPYEGYTELFAVRKEIDGMLSAGLGR